MARVKFGAIITSVKGKIGGTVLQGGRSGGIMKNLPQAKGESGKRIGVTALAVGKSKTINFGIVTKQWSKESEADRISWESLLGVYTFIDKFGDVYNGTAYQIYTSMNLLCKALNIALKTTAPVQLSAFDPVTTIYADDGLGGQTPNTYNLSEAFNIAFGDATADAQKVSVEISQGMSASQAVGLAKFQQMLVITADSLVATNLASYVNARFGFIPVVGSYFYIRTYTTTPDYPRKQFVSVFKIVVGV